MEEQENQEKLARLLQDLIDGKIPPHESDLWKLGKAQYQPARPVIESFLTHDDPEIRIAALQILVWYFGANERKHWEIARDFLADDVDGYLTEGIILLGCLKRNTSDEETLRLLAPLVNNTQEDRIVRNAAYCAMREIISFDPFEQGRIMKLRGSDFEQEVDWDLVRKYL